MERPVLAARHPRRVDVEAGEQYMWCACGRSKNQPFCDGSHRGTPFTPKAFTPDETGQVTLCLCKRTGNAPFCDGTHARLDADGEPPADTGGAPSAVPTPEEPTVARVHELARDGLEKTGHHGELVAMGVPRPTLPSWDDIQFLTAQFATRPLPDDAAVATALTIGPRAAKPLVLDDPAASSRT